MDLKHDARLFKAVIHFGSAKEKYKGLTEAWVRLATAYNKDMPPDDLKRYMDKREIFLNHKVHRGFIEISLMGSKKQAYNIRTLLNSFLLPRPINNSVWHQIVKDMKVEDTKSSILETILGEIYGNDYAHPSVYPVVADVPVKEVFDRINNKTLSIIEASKDAIISIPAYKLEDSDPIPDFQPRVLARGDHLIAIRPFEITSLGDYISLFLLREGILERYRQWAKSPDFVVSIERETLTNFIFWMIVRNHPRMPPVNLDSEELVLFLNQNLSCLKKRVKSYYRYKIRPNFFDIVRFWEPFLLRRLDIREQDFFKILDDYRVGQISGFMGVNR